MDRIEYLTHITSLDKLESIMTRGLICPEDLYDNEEYRKHVGDHYYNKTKNFVYMSMYTGLMKNNGLTPFSIRKGQVVIMIDPSILNDYDFILNATWDEQNSDNIIDSTEYDDVTSEAEFERIIEQAENANLKYEELPEFKFFGSIGNLKDYIQGFKFIFNECDEQSGINITEIDSRELFMLDNKSVDPQIVEHYCTLYDRFNDIILLLKKYTYTIQCIKVTSDDDEDKSLHLHFSNFISLISFL